MKSFGEKGKRKKKKIGGTLSPSQLIILLCVCMLDQGIIKKIFFEFNKFICYVTSSFFIASFIASQLFKKKTFKKIFFSQK